MKEVHGQEVGRVEEIGAQGLCALALLEDEEIPDDQSGKEETTHSEAASSEDLDL